MATGKRASMREGPLADLFRKTEEAAPAPRPEPPREEPRVPSPQERLRHAFSADIPDDIMERPVEREPEFHEPEVRSWAPAESEPAFAGAPVLRVVGVGGGGVNAVNRMVEAGITGVEFLAVNTDVQSLQGSTADRTLHIGDAITRGLGSGSDPDVGRSAATDDIDHIKNLLKGSDMVFVAAGEGGGTGTGAAPVVARVARDLGALTVGIVTKPFGFEGSRRRETA
jgi:cell division protein FtsZ